MKELVEIAQKYNLTNVENLINDVENRDFKIYIAFLGEFSSGKSSLINSLLENKTLPTMEKPTSKRIVEIESKKIDKIVPYKVTEKGIEKISMMEFEDLSLSAGEEKVYLEVPLNDFFKEGYIIVDTPGIDSLDKMDSDITFGYLPFLDGAIICQDIQKGTLPKSMLDFLLKPEIKPLLNNFLFAITKSDLKTDKAAREIKKGIVKQLEQLNRTNNLSIENIKDRVVLTSIHKDLSDFKNSFKKIILSNKDKIEQQRKLKELEKIKITLIKSLESHKNNLTLSTEDIQEKESNLIEEIENLKEEEDKAKRKLRKVEDNLKKDISRTLERTIANMKQVKSPEELKGIENKIQEEITNVINKNVTLAFGENEKAQNLDISVKISDDIKNIIRTIDIGKTILTFILADLIIPGGGLIGDAQGVGGVAFRELAKKEARNLAIKTASGMARTSKQQNDNNAGNIKSTLQQILVKFDKINPVEIAGDMIKDKLIESKMNKEIPNITNEICEMIISELECGIEETLSNVRLELNIKKNLLSNLHEEKNQRLEKFSLHINQIEEDIKRLQGDK